MFPLELSDRIIDYLHDDTATLKNCSHVHRTWTQSIRLHLFHSVVISTPKAWAQLTDLLITSSSICACISHVSIDAKSGLLPYVIEKEENLQVETTLAYLLRDVRSLELIAVALNGSHDTISMYIRTNFLQVEELRLNSVSAPTPTVIQDCVLSPRTKLVYVSFSDTTVSDPVGGRAMQLLRYRSLEIDRFAFSMPMDLHHNWMFHHEEVHAHPKSNVESMRIRDIRFKNIDFVVHALKVLGHSLRSLDLDIWGDGTYHYPEQSYELLAFNENLRHFTWRDHGSLPSRIPAEICNVLGASRCLERLETIILHLSSRSLVLGKENYRVLMQGAWNTVAELLQSDRLPLLTSLKLELSQSWCLALLGQDGGYSVFFEGVFHQLHSDGRLHVQMMDQ